MLSPMIGFMGGKKAASDFLADDNPDLLVFYKFDINAGNVAVDSSIQGNNGATTGIVVDPGYIGAGSFSFINNPVQSLVEKPVLAYVTPATLITMSGDYAFSFWFQIGPTIDALGNDQLGYENTGTNELDRIVIRNNGGNFRYNFQSGGGGGTVRFDETTGPIDQNWHMFTVSRTVNTNTVYIDGVQLGPTFSWAGDFRVAAIGTAQLPDSQRACRSIIDHLRVFDRAITLAEISELYNE